MRREFSCSIYKVYSRNVLAVLACVGCMGSFCYADSTFGKTAEELEKEHGAIKNLTSSTKKFSLERCELQDSELKWRDCSLPRQLVCMPEDAVLEGGVKREKTPVGRMVLGGWNRKGASAAWNIDALEGGEYVVEMTCTVSSPNGVKMLLNAGGKKRNIQLPQTCDRTLFSQSFPVGSFSLDKGKINISLHLEADGEDVLWLDSLRIVPKRDWKEGIKLYPENFYRLNGLRFSQDKKHHCSLPVLWESKSLANLICWRVDVPKSGRYRVEVDSVCSTPGWQVKLVIGSSREVIWNMPLAERREHSWKTLILGEYEFKKGHMPIRIAAVDKSRDGVRFMDVYAIRLIPVSNDEETGN